MTSDKTLLVYTPVEEIPKIHDDLKASFNLHRPFPIAYRKKQLLALAYLIKDNIESFQRALFADLSRPTLEANFFDINGTLSQIMEAYHSVEKWAKPETPPFSIGWMAVTRQTRKEAKGVVLIIGPFNFPLWSLLGPAAAAIAAGNTLVLKPSEQTTAVSTLIAELVPKYMDPDVCRVVNGSVTETTKLLELPWDHILYTGSGRVGKIVSAAAAKHLTPVTLELGGKSPAIIDPSCDMELAARRILWGKNCNAGQICISPDYVLVPKDVQGKFVEALKKEYAAFYPEGPRKSESFARIISSAQFSRIKTLLDTTKGEVIVGGETDAEENYVAPTIVIDVKSDDSLMADELFAPILPIVSVANVDEAVSFINTRDHPLSLYLFSRDARIKEKVLSQTQSGGVGINDVIIQAPAEGLPFGGTGPSGSGYHTGKAGFDTFTHLRAVIDSPWWYDWIMGGRFPPYTAKNDKFLNSLILPSLPARDT